MMVCDYNPTIKGCGACDLAHSEAEADGCGWRRMTVGERLAALDCNYLRALATAYTFGVVFVASLAIFPLGIFESIFENAREIRKIMAGSIESI
jgi:hypothetical protein